MSARLFFLAACVIALSACEALVTPVGQLGYDDMIRDVSGWYDYSPVAVEVREAEAPRDLIAGATLRFYEDGHGNQIEHYGADGRAYLWYPGNTGAVPSTWEITPVPDAPKGYWYICFIYPTNSYNPLTQEAGGKRECTPLEIFVATLQERVEGDPLDLSSGNVPWVLAKSEPLTIGDAVARADGAAIPN